MCVPENGDKRTKIRAKHFLDFPNISIRARENSSCLVIISILGDGMYYIDKQRSDYTRTSSDNQVVWLTYTIA